MRRSAMWVGIAAMAVACTGDTVGPTQDEALPIFSDVTGLADCNR